MTTQAEAENLNMEEIQCLMKSKTVINFVNERFGQYTVIAKCASGHKQLIKIVVAVDPNGDIAVNKVKTENLTGVGGR